MVRKGIFDIQNKWRIKYKLFLTMQKYFNIFSFNQQGIINV